MMRLGSTWPGGTLNIIWDFKNDISNADLTNEVSNQTLLLTSRDAGAGDGRERSCLPTDQELPEAADFVVQILPGDRFAR